MESLFLRPKLIFLISVGVSVWHQYSFVGHEERIGFLIDLYCVI